MRRGSGSAEKWGGFGCPLSFSVAVDNVSFEGQVHDKHYEQWPRGVDIPLDSQIDYHTMKNAWKFHQGCRSS